MVVTPAEAVRPIFGESRDVYVRATDGHGVGGGPGPADRSVAGLPRRARRRRRSRPCGAASPGWPPIANAAPWVAVAPCLLVVLGRDRGTGGGRRDRRVLLRVRLDHGRASARRPAAAHDVRHGARRARAAGGCGRCSSRRRWPSVVDGLKLAAPAALAGAIFGEWYGAERGLGVLLISGDAGRPARAAVGGVAAVRRVRPARLRRARPGSAGLVAGRYGAAIAQRQPEPPRPAHGASRARRGRSTVAALVARRRRGVVGVDRARRHLPARRPAPGAGVGRPRGRARATTCRRPCRRWRTAAVGVRARRRSPGSPRRSLATRLRFLAGMTVPRGGRAGRDAARRAVPAVRPGLRLRARHGADPRRGDGVLPRLRLRPVGARRRPASRRWTSSTRWAASTGRRFRLRRRARGRAPRRQRHAGSPPGRPSSPPSSARA